MQKVLGFEFIERYVNAFKQLSNAKIEIFGMDTFLINEQLGIDFSYDEDNELKTIFFYGYEHEGYSKFNETLPFNLNFNLGRDGIRAMFGEPFKSTEAIPALEVNAGDIYKQDGYYIGLEYTKDFKKLSIIKVYLWD